MATQYFFKDYKKLKGKPQWKFAEHILDKGLVPWSCEELFQLNKRQPYKVIGKWFEVSSQY